ncbi:MAG: VanZ family protein [Armatimonadetes bacterium]|nr:VanZ family protein [Armatimonadota bacterium]
MKSLKLFFVLWGMWMYFSSAVVITRFEFARAVGRLVHSRQPLLMRFTEGTWWITDRVYHVVEFTILSMLALKLSPYLQKRPFALIPMALLIGAADEYHQLLVNAGAAHTYDVLIDAIGAGVVLWVYVRGSIKRESMTAIVA